MSRIQLPAATTRRGPFYHLSGEARLDRLYLEASGAAEPAAFATAALRALAIDTSIAPDDLARFPREGGAILLANRPTGIVEGLALLQQLLAIRPDVRLIATPELAACEPLRAHLFQIAEGKRPAVIRHNQVTVRQAVAWARRGGVLVIFPARGAAYLQLRRRRIADPSWNPDVARLIRLAGTPVLPVFCRYRGPALARFANLLHPRLQAVFEPRLLLNQRGGTLAIHAGTPIQPAVLDRFATPADLIRYLRFRTYLPGRRDGLAASPAPASPMAEVAAPIHPDLIEAEIAQLPAEQKLFETKDRQVFYATESQIPALMLEIGRLRELTFREVGEGSGKPRDLDAYDAWYHQLFVWSPADRQVVGAYRLGMVDRILAGHGVDGLYTNSLFKVQPQLFYRLGKALEMGRSFVQPAYQRSYDSLLLLWKGIGHFVAANPDYRVLFGAVSVSNDYQGLSRQLLARYLSRNAADTVLGQFVRPRHPLRLHRNGEADPTAFLPLVDTVEEVSAWIADLEPDRKGVPVLIKHYLKLGGRILAMSVDPDFNHTLDGLIMVDFDRTDPKLLARYMSKEGLARFQAHPRS